MFAISAAAVASSLPVQLLIILLGPPAMAFMWLLFSRGLTDSLGTSDDDAVKGWTQSGFWIVLGLCYVVSIVMFIYAHFPSFWTVLCLCGVAGIAVFVYLHFLSDSD